MFIFDVFCDIICFGGIMQILNDLLNKLVNENLIKLAYIEKPLTERHDNVNLHLIFNQNNNSEEHLKMIKNFLESKSFLSYSSIADNILHFISEDGLSLYLHADNRIYDYPQKVVVYNPLKLEEDNQFLLKEDDVIGDMVKAIYGLTYELQNTYQFCLESEVVLGLFCLNKANNFLFQFLSDYYLFNPKNHSYNYLLTKMELDKAEQFKQILAVAKYDSVMECAKMIVWFIDDYISRMPINVAKNIEIDYYLYMKRQINGL